VTAEWALTTLLSSSASDPNDRDRAEMIVGVTGFSAQGLFVREKNELIKDPAAAREIIERRVTNLLSRQPALARLGIV
jgi:hypothetical protein